MSRRDRAPHCDMRPLLIWAVLSFQHERRNAGLGYEAWPTRAQQSSPDCRAGRLRAPASKARIRPTSRAAITTTRIGHSSTIVFRPDAGRQPRHPNHNSPSAGTCRPWQSKRLGVAIRMFFPGQGRVSGRCGQPCRRFSSPMRISPLSREVKGGTLRRIGSRLYTRNLKRPAGTGKPPPTARDCATRSCL